MDCVSDSNIIKWYILWGNPHMTLVSVKSVTRYANVTPTIARQHLTG